jgi:Flp pilus assembly protein TadG
MILPASPSSRLAPRLTWRRAIAAVEFAVVAPFLVLLATGTFEIARGVIVRQVLTDAVRKACRNGALPGRANAAITADVNDILTDNSIPTAYATITILVNGQAVDASTAQQGDQISVKAALPFNKVAWTPLFFFTNSSIESGTLVMMRQG